MPGRRTRIDAGHIIAYQDGGHRYLKDGVVVIPKKALHTAGSRRYVQYMAGGARKTVDVTVGISSATDVEITGGLSEGQLVLVP